MKFGFYINLGSLTSSNWQATLAKAAALRDAGVRHVLACGADVDIMKVAKKDADWLAGFKTTIDGRLQQLADLGLTCGVRPTPRIAERVKLTPSPPDPAVLTFDFTIRRTCIEAVNTLTVGNHYVYVAHEAHSYLDGHQRASLVSQVGPCAIIYYGFRGWWKRFGKDFGQYDLPHVAHVALNGAGAGDEEDGFGPDPADTKPKDILEVTRELGQRIAEANLPAGYRWHAHINVRSDTTAARMVALLEAACKPLPCWDVLMLRLVDDKGETIHQPTPAMLEAIMELAE